MRPRVLVVGSANADLVITADRFPEPGETILNGSFAIHAGGKGANQAVAAARAGAEVAFVGALGDDANGDLVAAALKDADVGIGSSERLIGIPTGVGVIFIDKNGENRIVVASGANLRLSSKKVENAISSFPDDGIVLAQLEIPLDCVRAAGMHPRFILNPAPAQEVPDEILGRCFAVTPNQWETKAITGIWPEDPISCCQAAKWFLDRGVGHAVLTLGAFGASWHSQNGSARFPAQDVCVADTTAAGDAFSGTLAGCLAAGMDMLEAVRVSVDAATLSVTRPGAIPSLPTTEEIALIKSGKMPV